MHVLAPEGEVVLTTGVALKFVGSSFIDSYHRNLVCWYGSFHSPLPFLGVSGQLGQGC
jgi:hypothetical protein